MSEWKPIPGETPIDDISGLKIKTIRTRRALGVVEQANITLAITKYAVAIPTRRSAPFTLNWMLKLHREMFGQVWKWAGMLRTTELNIGVPATQIESSLHALAEDLAFWEKESIIPLVDQSAMLHHRAVAIHPFLNGNGRWARLLANIWLRRHKQHVIDWPEQTIGTESTIRQTYLTAIRAADKGDLAPLLALHRQYTTTSY